MSIDTRKFRQPTNFDLHKRAQNAIAQGYLTNSKRPESLIKGCFPTHLKEGRGCHVTDYQGKKYIDFITGLGTNLFGYANEKITGQAIGALMRGNLLSLGSEDEVVCAETLKQVFPFVDCFKFLKTGSEACSAAIKIARAKTGRNMVLSEGYHGWHDNFVSLTEPHLGTLTPNELNMGHLSKYVIDTSIAAIIVEPVITDFSDERRAYLNELRRLCDLHGVMLIFDEVITGFRFPNYCVSNYWGIQPDLICLGKAMSNGLPLAAVGGKYSTMNDVEYFVSSSYASCMDALNACTKIVYMLEKDLSINDLWEAGAKFINDFNAIWPSEIRIEGYPTRGVFKGNELVKALLFQEACYAGILLGPSWFFNFPLMEQASNVLHTLKDIISKIQLGMVTLEGELPKSPFSQKVREQ